MEHTKEQEKILCDALRAIRQTPMKPGIIYTHPIDFEPSEKWVQEFEEVGFDVVENKKFGVWYISTKINKMQSKFLNSTETTGGYSVRNLQKISGATIMGDWQDPETLKWTRIHWDEQTGKSLRFNGSSSNYDLVAPGELNAEDKINAYINKDKNYPFGE